VDNGPLWQTNFNTSSLSDGLHLFYFLGVNTAGFSNQVVQSNFIDNSGPQFISNNLSLNSGETGLFGNNIVFQPFFTDQYSGVADIFLQTNSGAFIPATSLSFTESGTYQVIYYAADSNGLAGAFISNTLVIDKEGPIFLSNNFNTAAGSSYTNYSGTDFFFDYSDSLSGLQTIYFRTNSSAWQSGSNLIFTPGLYYLIETCAVDQAGNYSLTNQFSVYTVNLYIRETNTGISTYLTGNYTFQGLITNNIGTITETVLDFQIDTQVTVTLETNISGSWQHLLDTTGLSDGSHIFSFYISDSNNISNQIKLTNIVDNSPPLVSLVQDISNAPLYGENQLDFQLSDSHSGIAGGRVIFSNTNGILNSVSFSSSTGYQYLLNSTVYSNGSYILTVIVTNNAGLSVSASWPLTIFNIDFVPIVGPNPCAAGNSLFIQGLSWDCTVSIYSVNGILVRSFNQAAVNDMLNSGGMMLLEWDKNNTTGEQCAPGVYLVYITSPQKSGSLVRKISIIE
ncbi:MAG TPA: hypothetical protein VKS21_09345, partial [Spirochaetota bacterium]|nr:hypothetical protein [Spirochaetota bacterium]